jgi:hypothetical protein
MTNNYKGFYKFLYYLDKAKIIKNIRAKTRGDNIFIKPDKIYLTDVTLY